MIAPISHESPTRQLFIETPDTGDYTDYHFDSIKRYIACVYLSFLPLCACVCFSFARFSCDRFCRLGACIRWRFINLLDYLDALWSSTIGVCKMSFQLCEGNGVLLDYQTRRTSRRISINPTRTIFSCARLYLGVDTHQISICVIKFALGKANFLFTIRAYPCRRFRSNETARKHHHQQYDTDDPDTCCNHLKAVHYFVLLISRTSVQYTKTFRVAAADASLHSHRRCSLLPSWLAFVYT